MEESLFQNTVARQHMNSDLGARARIPIRSHRESSLSISKEMVRGGPLLSVVIPAKDESERLPQTLQGLRSELELLEITYEIIVVDDGSKDDTREKLAKIFGQSINLLSHKKRRGLAAAFRSGASNAQGKYIMLCPADISDFSFLSDSLESCRNFDLVSVSKRHPESIVIGYDKWRWFLSNNYHRIVTLLFNIPKSCRDTHYIKIYRSDLLREILPFCRVNGAVGETEMIFYAAQKGAKMLDIPGRVVHNHNNSKTSLRRVVETFLDLIRLRIHLPVARFK